MSYNCDNCNYLTKYSSNYNKHLKTKKHLNNQAKGDLCSIENEVEKTHKGDKMNQNEPQMNQNEPQMNQNEPQMNQLELTKDYNCNFCNRDFCTKASLRRHMIHRCKNKENIHLLKNSEKYIKKLEKEKEQLYKHIEALIKKAGNTTTTNNLNLNSYGKEDLSHITDSFKTNLIKGPFRMIPKMIEAVHFNDKKPENKNISLTNKKENVIKVFKGGKWKYYNKNDIMEELMETNYYLLDSHYEIDNELNGVQKTRYSKFQEKYDLGELSKDTKDCINLLLLNGAE